MKSTIIVLAFAFCMSASLAASTTTVKVQPIPDGVPKTLAGYTGFSVSDCRGVKSLVDPFIKFVPSVIINFVNQKKIAPASYSVFMTYAYRSTVANGYNNRYFFKTYDPSNKSGYVYKGYFDVFWPKVTGVKATLGDQVILSKVRRS